MVILKVQEWIPTLQEWMLKLKEWVRLLKLHECVQLLKTAGVRAAAETAGVRVDAETSGVSAENFSAASGQLTNEHHDEAIDYESESSEDFESDGRTIRMVKHLKPKVKPIFMSL